MIFDDEDILTLRPLFGLDMQRVADELARIPGSFPDPYEKDTWVLVVPAYQRRRQEAWHKEHPGEHTGEARVSLLPDHVVMVVQGTGIASWGRAQKFVAWLLALGPFGLIRRDKDVGRVAALSDVYAETWPDPDATSNPTEDPPRTGLLTTLRRHYEGASEEVAVHDSGFMSYTRRQGDQFRVWRGRLTASLCERWPAMVERVRPLCSEEAGPGGQYADPVYLMINNPNDDGDEVMLHGAHPSPRYREMVELLDGFRAAILRDPGQAPEGVTDFVLPGD
jgi:hypothetical protein